MGAHVPTVVFVAEVVVVVVPVGPVVVVVVATVVVVAATVVVVLPIGIGSVGIGNWAICTRVSATGCGAGAVALLSDPRARVGHGLRIAGVVAAGRKARLCGSKLCDGEKKNEAKRRRAYDLMVRLLPARRSATSATSGSELLDNWLDHWVSARPWPSFPSARLPGAASTRTSPSSCATRSSTRVSRPARSSRPSASWRRSSE